MSDQRHIDDWILNQKKIELHRHLEGSIPFSLLWHLKRNGKLPIEVKSIDELKSTIALTNPQKDLSSVLARFSIFQEVFSSYELVQQIVRETILQAACENIEYLELRFSPHFMASKFNLDWGKMMCAMIDGLDEAQSINASISVKFIVIVSRSFGIDAAEKTATFAKQWKREIVGFDFADDEITHPPYVFTNVAKKIRDIGLPITVHTGEGTDPTFIKATLELFKPQRIGHATTLIDDPSLIEYCIKHRVCVESSPTSNVITRVVKSYESHPITTLLKAGVPVCINTDDPTLFDCELNEEWQRAINLIGLTKDHLIQMNKTAEQFKF